MKGKVSLFYAYSPEDKQIIAYQTGYRSAKTIQKLYKQLDFLQMDWICMDN